MAQQRRQILILTIYLASTTAGIAAEWSATPSVKLQQEYNDNIRMTNQPHDSVWGTVLAPRLERQLPRWRAETYI